MDDLSLEEMSGEINERKQILASSECGRHRGWGWFCLISALLLSIDLTVFMLLGDDFHYVFLAIVLSGICGYILI